MMYHQIVRSESMNHIAVTRKITCQLQYPAIINDTYSLHAEWHNNQQFYCCAELRYGFCFVCLLGV